MTTKSKAQHTPGPWYIGEQIAINCVPGDVPAYWGIGNGKAHIARAVNTGCVPGDQALANARLIAAAPDLLAALQAVKIMADAKHAELDGGADYHAVAADMMTRMAHLSHRIGDVIAKAEGR